MNKDLIETPRFICSLGDEVLLKGRIVAFDVDENKCVENVVRLEYGQTLNVPNFNIYTKNNIIYELEKVKVPQFVADWIEYCKVKKITLAHALYRSEEAKNKSVYRWIVEGSGHQETFARAWLDGYEVEKEKRYLVKVKGMNSMNGYLARNKNLGTWYFGISGNDKNHCTHHTHKEIEDAGFGWVFDCPGIQIEEE